MSYLRIRLRLSQNPAHVIIILEYSSFWRYSPPDQRASLSTKETTSVFSGSQSFQCVSWKCSTLAFPLPVGFVSNGIAIVLFHIIFKVLAESYMVGTAQRTGFQLVCLPPGNEPCSAIIHNSPGKDAPIRLSIVKKSVGRKDQSWHCINVVKSKIYTNVWPTPKFRL